jgi:hypothetical protein
MRPSITEINATSGVMPVFDTRRPPGSKLAKMGSLPYRQGVESEIKLHLALRPSITEIKATSGLMPVFATSRPPGLKLAKMGEARFCRKLYYAAQCNVYLPQSIFFTCLRDMQFA